MKIFHLSEPKHGWVDISFGDPPETYTLAVSDVPNDCLRDLAAAVARILDYSVHEVVEFSLEPDFATCDLYRHSDLVRVVLRLANHEEAVFEQTFSLKKFAHRVRFEMLRIKPCYSSEDGWTQPFPEQEVADLD